MNKDEVPDALSLFARVCRRRYEFTYPSFIRREP